MRQIGKHKKLRYIECSYWSCANMAVTFKVNAEAEKFCHDKVKGILNLAGHEGSNAPKWCQRRRVNGGL